MSTKRIQPAPVGEPGKTKGEPSADENMADAPTDGKPLGETGQDTPRRHRAREGYGPDESKRADEH